MKLGRMDWKSSKHWLRTGSIAGICMGVWYAAPALAAEAADVAAPATTAAGLPDTSGLSGFFIGLAQQHPWIATVLLIVGALRVLFKPVMAVIESFIKDNCSAEEYAKLQHFESGPIYKWINFGLDMVGSIKLPVIGVKPANK